MNHVDGKKPVNKNNQNKRANRAVKKKKPTFNVLNLGFFKSVKARWRKPRGTHNKKRMKFAWAGALPKIGYRNAVSIRGLHPTGVPEVLIHTPSELDTLKEPQAVRVRIGSSVGGRKRKLIEDKAKSLGLLVLNPTSATSWSGKKESKQSKQPKQPGKAAELHVPNKGV